MQRNRLYALFLACLLQPVVGALDSQSYLQPGLGLGLGKKETAQGLLEHKPIKEPSCEQFVRCFFLVAHKHWSFNDVLQPTGPIETTSCDYETVESVTEDLYTDLHDLVETPFFKFFRVDLYRECPFWQENGFCMNRECGITTVDEVCCQFLFCLLLISSFLTDTFLERNSRKMASSCSE
jgi:ERO1-like protein beta